MMSDDVRRIHNNQTHAYSQVAERRGQNTQLVMRNVYSHLGLKRSVFTVMSK